MLPPCLTIIFSICLLSAVDLAIAAFLALVSGGLAWILLRWAARGRPLHQEYASSAAAVDGELVDVINNISVVRAFSALPAAPRRSRLVFERDARLRARGARRLCVGRRVVSARRNIVARRAEIARKKASRVVDLLLAADDCIRARGRRKRRAFPIAPRGACSIGWPRLAPCANSPGAPIFGSTDCDERIADMRTMKALRARRRCAARDACAVETSRDRGGKRVCCSTPISSICRRRCAGANGWNASRRRSSSHPRRSRATRWSNWSGAIAISMS